MQRVRFVFSEMHPLVFTGNEVGLSNFKRTDQRIQLGQVWGKARGGLLVERVDRFGKVGRKIGRGYALLA